MSVFWIVATLLLAAALLFVLPPLLRTPQGAASGSRNAANAAVYREELAQLDRDLDAGQIDAQTHTQARLEIERRVLEEAGGAEPASARAPEARMRWSVAGSVGILVPLLSLLGYLQLGNPGALRPASVADRAPHAVDAEQIAAMTERLSARLKQSPGDAEGWILLARSFTALGRHEEAAQAYARLAVLAVGNPDVLADQADALAMARGRRLDGEPFEIVKRALSINPNHIKALALAGSAEFERRNLAAAAQYWERALAQLPAESPFAGSLRGSLDQARAGASAAGGTAPR